MENLHGCTDSHVFSWPIICLQDLFEFICITHLYNFLAMLPLAVKDFLWLFKPAEQLNLVPPYLCLEN